MFIPDLTPHTYQVPTGLPGVLAIGWLDGRHEFPTGKVGLRVAWKIRRLVEHPVLLYRGFHVCELCPMPNDGFENIPEEMMGNGEVWLEAPDGVTYSFPTLLPHYMKRHRYLPPSAFVNAVKRGKPLSDSQCEARIYAHGSRLAKYPDPEDILVPYYTVRIMWRADDFENLMHFEAQLRQFTEISQIGLRDFGYYYEEEAHDPSEPFHRMWASCQSLQVAAPYGYRYCQPLLSQDETVVIP